MTVEELELPCAVLSLLPTGVLHSRLFTWMRRGDGVMQGIFRLSADTAGKFARDAVSQFEATTDLTLAQL